MQLKTKVLLLQIIWLKNIPKYENNKVPLQVVPYGEPVAAVDAQGQFSVPVDSPHSSDR